MGLSWSSDMAIDHGVIDGDHQMLVQLVDDFCGLDPRRCGKLELALRLAELSRQTAAHFSREEQLQTAVHFPLSDAHRREHADLMRQFGDLAGRLAGLDIPERAPLAVAEAYPERAARPQPAGWEAIKAMLRTWLLDHMVQSDLLMRPFVHPATVPSSWSNRQIDKALQAGRTHATSARSGGLTPRARGEIVRMMRDEARALNFIGLIDPECRAFRKGSLANLLAIWRSKAGPSGLPRRRDLPLHLLHDYAERMAVFEAVDGPHHRRRYFARSLARRSGNGQTGSFVDEMVPPGHLKRWNLVLDGVLAQAAPLRLIGVPESFNHDRLVAESLVAPLLDDHGNARFVLMAVDYHQGLSWSDVEAEEGTRLSA